MDGKVEYGNELDANELDLPGIKVVSREEKKRSILYTVEAIERPVCWQCGCANVKIHRTTERNIRDLPRFGKHVGLVLKVHDYKCPACHVTTHDNFDDIIDGTMTRRLKQQIGEAGLYHTMDEVASMYEVSSSEANNCFNAMYTEWAKEYKPSIPSCLFIEYLNEKYVIYASLDLSTPGRVLMLDDKCSEENVKHYLRKLGSLSRCEVIVIDMNEPIKRAVLQLRGTNTKIAVARRFVIKEIDTTAQMSFRLTANIIAKKDSHMSRYSTILTKHGSILRDDEKDKLAEYLKKYPRFESAYHAKEDLISLVSTSTSAAFDEKYLQWKQNCLDQLLTSFKPLMEKIEDWHTEILAGLDLDEHYEDQIITVERTISSIQNDAKGLHKIGNFEAKAAYRAIVPEPKFAKNVFDEFDLQR